MLISLKLHSVREKALWRSVLRYILEVRALYMIVCLFGQALLKNILNLRFQACLSAVTFNGEVCFPFFKRVTVYFILYVFH